MKKKHAGKCILFLFMVALALLYVIPFFMMGLGSFKTQAEKPAGHAMKACPAVCIVMVNSFEEGKCKQTGWSGICAVFA